MRKIIIAASILTAFAVGCKKEDNVSQVVAVSYPTITVTGSQFYSINVNGAAPDIQATAYDSTIGESYPAEYDASVIDVTTPGLYVVPITATNKFGYIGSNVVYVAVTEISDAIDLSGTYVRTANNEPVHITKMARGLYETDDVGGAASLEITAYFAQIDDSTLSFPYQPTAAGELGVIDPAVGVNDDGDTTLSWNVDNVFFGTQRRTFVKQ